jgi:hypothetical protein
VTDFIFLISPQEIAAALLAGALFVVCLIAFVIMGEWVLEMFDNYNADDWHMEDDDARKRD